MIGPQRDPATPWKQISGFRNILVHNYLGDIDVETVMTVIRQHLPPFELAVRDIIRPSSVE